MFAVLYLFYNTYSSSDEVIEHAQPYLQKVALEDMGLRSYAASIASGCPSGEKECQLNKVYRHIVEGFNYYNDPRNKELIQTPYETIKIKGGDCEDLTILLNSLLENIGIKTYLVLTEQHAYSLACDINSEKLFPYIRKSIAEQISKDYSLSREIITEDEDIFELQQKQQAFALKSGHIFYYGNQEEQSLSNFTDYLNIKYSVSSEKPIDVYVVPSLEDYELLRESEKFMRYPSCSHENILKIEDSCNYLDSYGGVILQNHNYEDTEIELSTKFYFHYNLTDFFNEQKVWRYKLNNKDCVILDSTLGKYGYPGYNANITGEKIAIDPLTKEYLYLQ